jgi:hypothetical protein
MGTLAQHGLSVKLSAMDGLRGSPEWRSHSFGAPKLRALLQCRTASSRPDSIQYDRSQSEIAAQEHLCCRILRDDQKS